MRSRIIGAIALVFGLLGVWAIGSNPRDAPFGAWLGTMAFLVAGAYYLFTGIKQASLKKYLLEGKLSDDDCPVETEHRDQAARLFNRKTHARSVRQHLLTALVTTVILLLLLIAAFGSHQLIDQTGFDQEQKRFLYRTLYWSFALLILFAVVGVAILFAKIYMKKSK